MLVADGIQACVTLQKDGGTNPTCAEKGEIQLKNNYAMVLGKVMGREALSQWWSTASSQDSGWAEEHLVGQLSHCPRVLSPSAPTDTAAYAVT